MILLKVNSFYTPQTKLHTVFSLCPSVCRQWIVQSIISIRMTGTLSNHYQRSVTKQKGVVLSCFLIGMVLIILQFYVCLWDNFHDWYCVSLERASLNKMVLSTLVHQTIVMNILAIRFNSAWMVNAKFLVGWFQMQFQLSAKCDLENNEVFNRTQF